MLDFASAWEEVADLVPDRVAVMQGNQRYSYRAFDDAAARFATAIEASGVPGGGKVALYLYNCPEYLIAQHGAFKHRAVPVNVNYRYLDEELLYLLDNSDASVVVFHSSLSACVGRVRAQLPNVHLLVEVDDGGPHLEGALRFSELLETHEPQPRKPRSPDDLYMIYTGGTTGMPKGVMFKQGEFIDSLLTGRARLGIIPSTPTDLVGLRDLVEDYSRSGPHANIPCCPLMHGTGMWVGAMPALTTGSTVVLLESRSFDADEVWRLTERERVTLLAIVGDPFARPLLRALESREAEGRAVDTSSLRYVFSSGAIWSSEIKDGLRSRLSALLVDGLGSTEGLSFGVSGATRDQGAPTAHFILASDSKVVTEDGREVTRGTGEQGILASRTPAYGYYKDPERSARTFFRLEGKGYVLTGDWATVEEDGSVTLLGRGAMTINTGGEKVFAEEVEESIKRHHLVDDCLVVGVPDEQYGQRVVAVIGPSPSGTPTFEEICEFLRPSLAHYKIPKAVVVREHVQRAPNGKADYQWARQAALEGSSIG